MSRDWKAAISLVLFIPGLAAQHAVAAEDAASSGLSTASIVSSSPAIDATPEDASSRDNAIDQLFSLYRDARSAGMWDEADTLAKRIVDASIRENGRDSKVTAIALTNLAILQTSTEDNISAIQNFEAAIDIVERTDNRLSPDLIAPLRGMGTAQMQAGNIDHASAAWHRALHVSHVNFGPHNFEQVETLYAIARMFSNAGMHKDAGKIQKRIYYLYSRDVDMDGDESSPRL